MRVALTIGFIDVTPQLGADPVNQLVGRELSVSSGCLELVVEVLLKGAQRLLVDCRTHFLRA